MITLCDFMPSESVNQKLDCDLESLRKEFTKDYIEETLSVEGKKVCGQFR